MKQWLKKVSGIEAKEKELAEQQMKIDEENDKILLQADPKTYATKKKEPWVNVLDMKVNDDNIRNGFFELDWNDLFIEQLLSNGYGSEGDVPEEVVDRWFKDIVYNMLQDEGLDTTRNAGYINVVPLAKGKSEVS